jgi:hypothetical protein
MASAMADSILLPWHLLVVTLVGVEISPVI